MHIRLALAATVAALIALGVFVSGSAQASSTCLYSVRGCVHVGGYYKPSTGTYVQPYVRNYPGYRPSYGSTYRPSRSYRYGY
jgi:hypothetical protein